MGGKALIAPATPNAQPNSIVDPQKDSGSLHGLQMAVPRWSPDGSHVAFIGGLMSDQGATGGDVYLVASTGGNAVNLTPKSTDTAVWLSWSGKDSLIASEIEAGMSRIFSYHLNLSPDMVAPGGILEFEGNPMTGKLLLEVPAGISDGREAMSLSIAKDGTFAVSGSSFEKAPEVYVGELKPEAKLTQVTRINDAIKPAWGKAESIEWTNDGFRIQGWLMLPAQYDPGKKYPLVVMVHGGPSSAVVRAGPAQVSAAHR